MPWCDTVCSGGSMNDGSAKGMGGLQAFHVDEMLRSFISEDLRSGDITTDAIDADDIRAAGIISKADGIIAGLPEAARVFEILGCSVEVLVGEGSVVTAGMTVARIEGAGGDLLRAERVALNILGRMSGIATLTGRYVKAVRSTGCDAKVAATRKTTPGFRYFEKRAVTAGGGDPHRYALDDMVLVKENHIRLGGGMEAVLSKVRDAVSFTKKVEVEVESIGQFGIAVDLEPDIIMLDNMDPLKVRQCREFLRERVEKGGLRPLLEVSGNITLDNVGDYAPYCDIISVGALTHSYASLDFSMLIE